jgi:hypothetical protein
MQALFRMMEAENFPEVTEDMSFQMENTVVCLTG